MSTFLNYVSEKMIHTNTAKESGKEFATISISCPQSKTGLATISVNLGQILDAKKKDGTVVKGYKNLLLGAPDKTRKVSIATNKSKYKTVEMTNAAIAEMFNAERQAYRAAQKEA